MVPVTTIKISPLCKKNSITVSTKSYNLLKTIQATLQVLPRNFASTGNTYTTSTVRTIFNCSDL